MTTYSRRCDLTNIGSVRLALTTGLRHTFGGIRVERPRLVTWLIVTVHSVAIFAPWNGPHKPWLNRRSGVVDQLVSGKRQQRAAMGFGSRQCPARDPHHITSPKIHNMGTPSRRVSIEPARRPGHTTSKAATMSLLRKPITSRLIAAASNPTRRHLPTTIQRHYAAGEPETKTTSDDAPAPATNDSQMIKQENAKQSTPRHTPDWNVALDDRVS